jgi:EAL domain-containing protein (putative c-di-GMP-specific phosphodiesterase class I)/ActR/RegA family two-component response regulator
MGRVAPKLLVVDDEVELAATVSDLAEEIGFSPSATSSPEEFKRLYNHDYDVIVLDLLMPEVDGIELLRFLAEADCEASIVLMSGFDAHVLQAAAELAKAQGLRVVGSVKKPIRLEELESLLVSATSPERIDLHPEPGGPTAEELETALEEGQLHVFYQPRISLKLGSAVGLEALARWRHPQHGFFSPSLFIPLAEQTGLIEPLTDTVLRKACLQCRPWLDEKLISEVAVNMSAQMRDLELPESIISTLEEYGLTASQLVIEITETALMRELVKSLDVLTRLRMKGILLAIDDFGTGYSTMQQLQRYPFNEIKIDKSFVKNLTTDDESRAIVDTTIELGRRLKMRVVAEGVESVGALDYLRSQGCDMAQGYFIARPMPAAAVENWLRSAERTGRFAPR